MIIDRFSSGFHPFVLPFLAGMIFVLGYCLYGIIRILFQLPGEDRRKFLISLVTPKTAWKNVKDIFLNCLLHVKLWKRNKVLGYMHSSIAFGWFMIILLGHIEVMLFLPHRIRLFYYPIFFNFFVAETESTIQGAVLFFLMDFFLLIILSGIALAMIKRVRSRWFGMRRTTRASLLDTVGLYSLWAIFPLRLLCESFTAHISGGSFLTLPMNWIFRQFLGNELNYLPTWWAYSIALGVFMTVLPFTRYMHIPAEMMLIPLRNAGLHIRHPRKGFARVQFFSCPGCGVCIDACPMSVRKENLKDCTVYLNRQLRRGNEKRGKDGGLDMSALLKKWS
jgi:ferredoxin